MTTSSTSTRARWFSSKKATSRNTQIRGKRPWEWSPSGNRTRPASAGISSFFWTVTCQWCRGTKWPKSWRQKCWKGRFRTCLCVRIRRMWAMGIGWSVLSTNSTRSSRSRSRPTSSPRFWPIFSNEPNDRYISHRSKHSTPLKTRGKSGLFKSSRLVFNSSQLRI